jgi:hypothetical protein
MKRWLLAARPLCLLVLLGAAVIGELMVINPQYGMYPVPEPPRTEYLPHVIEAGKAYADIVAMLTTLGTGLFVLIALVARRSLLPTVRSRAGDLVIVALFAMSMSGAFFVAVHTRFAIAQGLLEHRLETDAIEHMIGMQAWLTLFGGLCACALIGEAFLTYRGIDGR